MATTSRPNPIPVEQVTIDVAVANGYPVAPPPPPPPSGNDTRHFKSKCASFLDDDVIIPFIVIFVLVVVGLYIQSKVTFPRFHLDSVSVDRANTTAVVWRIGFSIEEPVGELSVWVRFMGRDYKVDSVGTAGNTTVSVSTLLPRGRGFDYSGGSVITLEQVVFRCDNYNDYLLEATCKDVAVDVLGFLSNETTTSSSTQGIMQGGPRLCPLVHKEHIKH